MGKIRLSDIVKIPAFEEAGKYFHRATGMAVSFTDENGDVVFYPHEQRCEVCRMIQQTPKGLRRCLESDRRAAVKALQTAKPMAYRCHAGLMDVVVPVVIGDHRVGCFFSGQSLAEEPSQRYFEEVKARVADLGLDDAALAQAFFSVKHVDESALDLAMGLLSIICRHLVEGELTLTHERDLAREQRKLRRVAEHEARLERDLREMELRLVQAQLNPHFLFNALNLLVGQAVREGAEETSRLLLSLSTVLRSAVESVGKTVNLSDEIESARAYVEIFRARFGKDVAVEVDLPPALARVQVPALTLQPLVENALIHGLPRCEGRFLITLGARANGEWTDVLVADNGQGVERKELTVLRKRLRGSGQQGKLTGLVGLSRRLRYYYQEHAALSVDASETGFCVTVRVPS